MIYSNTCGPPGPPVVPGRPSVRPPGLGGDLVKWQRCQLVRFLGEIRIFAIDIAIQLARNIGFQKLETRLRLLLLLLLRLPQALLGGSRWCIIYIYRLSKPNIEEITDSSIGYRRVNTIILWTFSSEWCFEGRCCCPGLIVEHKCIISGDDDHKPYCQTYRHVLWRKH